MLCTRQIQLPLRIDLLLPSEREAIQPFVVTHVAEHRLHRGEALAVLDAPFRAVDARFHFVGVAHAIPLALKERHLSHLGFVRLEQAAITVRARHAVALRALELHRRIAVDRAVAAVAVELFCPPGRYRCPLAGRS